MTTAPFTPTALTSVLRQLQTGPLPALAAAAPQCAPARYTRALQAELARRCARVLRLLRALAGAVPRDGRPLPEAAKHGGGGRGRGSLASTGTLWAACDEVSVLAAAGAVGLLVEKAEQFRDTLRDVMEELKEWLEESDRAAEREGGNEDKEDGATGAGETRGGDDDDDDDDDDENDNDVDGLAETMQAAHISDSQALLDDLMNTHSRIPPDDPEQIRPRLESCLRRLRLTTLLYTAVIKRRIKAARPLPPAVASPSTAPSRLDEVLPLLRRLPDSFGALALAFYDLDAAEIDRLMDQCWFDAYAVAHLLSAPWRGERDEFTDWAARFQVEVKKN
ncbi:hypothetical protein P8C59_008983 [Phyllachora maydis]|nr:hypothetical protein P8C59_008983 [Phyllachora maydis]